MQTKSLLFGLIGFFAGGLLVSVAATTSNQGETYQGDSMGMMVSALKDTSGDDFDEAFLAGMIMHHQSALEMATLAESRAKHPEIRELSNAIIQSQQAEIDQMNAWQIEWNYDDSTHGGVSH